MARRLNYILLTALSALIGGCATSPERASIPPAELRQALDERLAVAGPQSLIIGDDSYRVSLDEMEARVAEAIVQVLPYDVEDGHSYGKGVGLMLIDEDGQFYVLTAAHVLFHPQSRERRGKDILLYASKQEGPPFILSGNNLEDKFSALMPGLSHLDDIILFRTSDHPSVNPLPLSVLVPPDLDAKPVVPDTQTLRSVSCDYLSDAHPSVCFAQTFTRLDAGRLGLYSAVTTDLDAYPGLSGSPVLATDGETLNVIAVVVSASTEKSCPNYDPPNCFTVIGPIPRDAVQSARERETLDVHPSRVEEPSEDDRRSSRTPAERGWWRDY